MDRRSLLNILLLIVLILIQVLICNHIMLFNVAVPFIYIYVITRLPMTMKTDWVLTWAFLAGFIVDLFSDTPGVNTIACVIMAMCKTPVLFAYIPKDDRTKDIVPCVSSLGFSDYSKYLFSMSLIYCILVFFIEFLSFTSVYDIVIMGVSSALFSFVLMLGIDSLMIKSKE